MRRLRAIVKTPRVRIVVALVALASLVSLGLLSRGSSGPAGTGPTTGGGISAATADPAASTSRATGDAQTSVGRVQPVLYVPPKLPAGKVPLVIALHGSGGTPVGMESTTGFDRFARANGFIVAYLGSDSPGGNWILPSETAYISSMISQLEASDPIDPTRVYVTGFSAGGYESYRSGCLLSNQVAAVAPVAVSMNRLLYDSCKLSRPVSALITIGSADTGHYGGYGKLPSAPEAAARWRALDGCPPEAPSSANAPGPTNQQLWLGCADGSAVGLDVVSGGTHIWPGPRLGSSTPDGMYEASAAIWAFFAAHRASSASTPDVRVLSVRAKLVGRTSEAVVTLLSGEPLTASAKLSLNRRTVASARRSLSRGTGDLILKPAHSSAGAYSLRLRLSDAYGRGLSLTRTVRLASASG
jgi:polyhydroxybutyrate depolymerase